MRASKTLLTITFLVSLTIAAFFLLNNMKGSASQPGEQILVATADLPAGTLLRAQDIAWRIVSETGTDQIVRPATAAVDAKPGIIEETQAGVYGAVLRYPLAAGEPVQRSKIVKPGERDFLQLVLSPNARAVAIPVATGGASTGLLSPGDHVDVVLTQNFKNDSAQDMRNTPVTRRSVGETIVQNLRVLAIDAIDTSKPTAFAAVNLAAGNFGRTVTLEVTPDQAEVISVASELGKLSLTLRSTQFAIATADPIKPKWAGDVSPALSGAAQEKPTAITPVPVLVIRGGNAIKDEFRREMIKPENDATNATH